MENGRGGGHGGEVMESQLEKLTEGGWAEALGYLVEVGQRQEKVIELQDTGDIRDLLLVDRDGSYEVRSQWKGAKPFEHHFATLDGFTGYLSSVHQIGPDGLPGEEQDERHEPSIVMVGEKSVVADLDYGSRVKQLAVLDLKPSEEFQGLLGLLKAEGHVQRPLWRLLITDLAGCLPDELALLIGAIRVKKDDEGSVVIDRSGVTSESGWRSRRSRGCGSCSTRVGCRGCCCGLGRRWWMSWRVCCRRGTRCTRGRCRSGCRQ
jgi:hypothetical protein